MTADGEPSLSLQAVRCLERTRMQRGLLGVWEKGRGLSLSPKPSTEVLEPPAPEKCRQRQCSSQGHLCPLKAGVLLVNCRWMHSRVVGDFFSGDVLHTGCGVVFLPFLSSVPKTSGVSPPQWCSPEQHGTGAGQAACLSPTVSALCQGSTRLCVQGT